MSGYLLQSALPQTEQKHFGQPSSGRVLAHELLAREEAEGAGREPRLRGGRGAGAPLAARAVAVARAQRLLGHLEAHAAAHAVPGVRRAGHYPSGEGGMRVSPVTPSIRSATSST